MSDLHFAQIREDSWIEREIADAERPQRIVAVASGGCTALSLLDDEVEEVIAVDASLQVERTSSRAKRSESMLR